MTTQADKLVKPQRFIFDEEMGDQLFRVENHRQGLFDMRLHFHPQYELTLMRGGVGQRVVGDHLSSYSDYDLVLLSPDLPHGWFPDHMVAPMMETQCLVIVFSRESLGPDFLSRVELQPLVQLLNRAVRGLHFPLSIAKQVAREWNALEQAVGLNKVARFLTLIQQLADTPDVQPLASEDYMTGGLQQRQEALASTLLFTLHHESPTPRLAEVAAHVGMSVPTFTRFFKRMTGMSFVRYINGHRLNRARVLLCETTRSVLDISLMAGYENLSHFNRQFLRSTGLTPTEFRAKRLPSGKRV